MMLESRATRELCRNGVPTRESPIQLKVFMEKLAEQPTLNHQNEQLNQELRVRTDTETWLAEALNGSMRTSFEYSYDGQELYGEDGGSMSKVFDDAIEASQVIAHENPSLLFELRRRLTEREELADMEAMAKGEMPNTMVVISDFPPELMDAKEDVGGYNAGRKQTMMRVISRQADGNIRITTQTLDGSNRQALEAIYKSLDKEVPEGEELLGERIHLDLPHEWQPNLTNNLTKAYDDSLAEQEGGTWHAGIRQPDQRAMVDTYKFACAQHDLIEWFTKEKLADPEGAEGLRYKLAATTSARYERFVRLQNTPESSVIGEVTPEAVITSYAVASGQSFYREIERESYRAARGGKTFSGCGSTARGGRGSKSETEDEVNELGYGNKSKSNSDDDCEFISKECPECHTKNVKTKVTKTHISGSCGCSKKRS